MNSQTLNSDAFAILKLVIDQLNTFDQVVEQLQAQINEFSFWISIFMLTESASSTDFKEVANITITAAKFEKLSDSFIFNEDQKELCFFITKFYLKLSENADQFLMNKNKINYIMSCLENNAAHIMNSFFQNDMFWTFDLFILLLKWIYDNTSHKHSAAMKLEEFWQWNHEFTSFFSEFLDLVKELKWNETAKIDAFR